MAVLTGAAGRGTLATMMEARNVYHGRVRGLSGHVAVRPGRVLEINDGTDTLAFVEKAFSGWFMEVYPA